MSDIATKLNTDTAFTHIYIYIYIYIYTHTHTHKDDRHNSCKEKQIDAQFIFSTFHQNSTSKQSRYRPGGAQSVSGS